MPVLIYDLPLKARKILRKINGDYIGKDYCGNYFYYGDYWGIYHSISSDDIEYLKKLGAIKLLRVNTNGGRAVEMWIKDICKTN